MKTFTLTPRALRDIDAIAEFSLATWGETQTETYLQEIKNRCAWLAENPLLGRARYDVAPGYRSFRQGAHIIFYTLDTETLYILGIPHAARDVATYFSE